MDDSNISSQMPLQLVTNFVQVPSEWSVEDTTHAWIHSDMINPEDVTGRDMTNWTQSMQLMQRTIPDAVRNKGLIQLAALDACENEYVKGRALRGILQILYVLVAEINEADLSELVRLIDVLSQSLVDGRSESAQVMSSRLHAYILTNFLIHQKRLLTEATKKEMPTMTNFIEGLKGKIAREKYTGPDFTLMVKVLKKFSSRWNLEKSALAVVTRASAIAKKVKDVMEFIVELRNESNTEKKNRKYEDCMMKKMTDETSWFECHMFLHFLTCMICTNEQLHRRLLHWFREMLNKMQGTKHLSKPTHYLSVVYAYVRLFTRFLTNSENQQILLEEKRGQMGFSALLKHIQSKPNCKCDMSQVLSPLFFHSNLIVSDLACQFSFDNNSIDQFAEAQLEYIVDLLQPSEFRVQTKIINCLECEYTTDQFHNRWEGTFGQWRKVALTVSHPPKSQDTKVITEEKRSSRAALVYEIDIVKRLTSGRRHCNILKLLAFQIDMNPVFHVTDNMGASTYLNKFLSDKAQNFPKLSLVDRVQYAVLPLISVVEFCHDKNVLLRSITSKSFLAMDRESSFKIILTAFHAARNSLPNQPAARPAKHTYRGDKYDRLPLLWSAPEAILTCLHTEYSDIHMVGHTILEILTGETPYSDFYQWSNEHKAIEVLANRILPKKSVSVPDQLFRPLMECLATIPHQRISLADLRKIFQQFLDDNRTAAVIEEQLIVAKAEPPFCQHIPESLKKIYTLEDLQRARPQPTISGVIQCTLAELKASDDPRQSGKDQMTSVLLRKLDGVHERLLVQLNHTNIVPMRGLFYTDCDVRVQMMTQLPSQRKLLSLLDYVLGKDMVPLEELYQYLIQIADAMQYLHSRNLLHCCLQARFVYMDLEGQKVQIGHLGRSTCIRPGTYDIDAQNTTVQPFLCIVPQCLTNSTRYSPREVNENGCYSMRSDVASFGYLIWEVWEANDSRPYTPQNVVAPYAHLPTDEVLWAQRKRQPLPQPPNCPDWLHELVLRCTMEPACHRPLFPEISEYLNSSMIKSGLERSNSIMSVMNQCDENCHCSSDSLDISPCNTCCNTEDEPEAHYENLPRRPSIQTETDHNASDREPIYVNGHVVQRYNTFNKNS